MKTQKTLTADFFYCW